MNNLTRWEPVRDFLSLRDAMDQLFDEMITQPGSLTSGGRITPAIDMYQTDDAVVVKASLAGIDPDELKISVTGDILTIQGEQVNETEDKQATYHIRERRWGSFSRSLTLPVPVQSDKAKAEYENGILTLTLPKAEEVRPKTITIKTK
jgi:HSP20 family protein